MDEDEKINGKLCSLHIDLEQARSNCNSVALAHQLRLWANDIEKVAPDGKLAIVQLKCSVNDEGKPVTRLQFIFTTE